MKEEVEWEHIGEIPVVLNFRQVRIWNFDESNDGSLPKDINDWPLDIKCSLFLIFEKLFSKGSKSLLVLHEEKEIGSRSDHKIEKETED